jgi:chitodextrinase
MPHFRCGHGNFNCQLNNKLHKKYALPGHMAVVAIAVIAGLASSLNTTQAAVSFVQQGSGEAPGASKSFSVSFPSNTTAGNLIAVAFDKDGGQTSTVTDSQGNAFTQIGGELISPAGYHSRVYYAKNIKGGADTVTITLPANSSFMESYITEYAGVDPTNPIDTQSGNSGSPGSVTSKSAVTAAAGDIIYGWCMADSGCSAGSGFSARSTFNHNLVEDMVGGAAGSYAATATANNGWTMQMVAFRPALGSDTTSPSVPANLTVTSLSTSTVSLSWIASMDNVGVAGYKIFRGGVQVGAGAVTNFTDIGLAASTAYSYTVSAFDAAGNNSVQSGAVQATTTSTVDVILPTIAITSPANNAVVSSAIIISGISSDNVAVASVAVSIDGGVYIGANGTTGWTYSWNTLSLANGTHSIVARATDASGNAATRTISVSVNNLDTSPPTVPTGLAVTGVTVFTVSLSWNASTDNVGVAGYAVFRDGLQVARTSGISYSDTGLGSSTTHAYAVAAYDSAGNTSAPSASVPASTQGMPAANFPAAVSPNGRYLVDQNGKPYFIQGDSPWFLTESLVAADVDYYLSSRWAQGYNSIILDIVAQSLDSGNAFDSNIYGQHPFTNILSGFTNLASVNLNYFTNIDWVINDAAKYGICVFAYPLYDGYGGAGWYHEMSGNSSNTLYSYGQFIGNRYKNFTNIVWIGAGDYSEPGALGNCLWNIVAAGIASMDTNHLITAQAARPSPASYYSRFITLNSSYPGQFTYIQSLANYQQSPVLASFDREPYYEHRNVTGTPFNDLDCRNFFWWSVTSGDAGCFYGDENQWPFASGWQSEMWDAGATTMTNVIKLMNTRPWYNCVPDSGHTTVTSGYGASGTMDYLTCMREATGKTIFIYIPRDQMTPTVDMTKVSGAAANAWWYNPRTGVATGIGSYNTTGTQTFTPPDTSDWVLVIDDASLNLQAPGTGVIDSTPPSVPANLTVQSVTSSSASLSWIVSTDNVGVAGYRIFRDGIQVGTSIAGATFADAGLSASTTYIYSVSAFDAMGNVSARSASMAATTQNAADITLPTAPTNLTLTYATPSSTSFSWNASTDNVGVAGYQILRNGVQVAVTRNTNYQDTNLLANTGYVYAVTAYDTAGNVSPQSVWRFSIQWSSP